MAIGVWIEMPGVTQKQYETVLKELNLGGKMYQGGLYHFAGECNGSWCVYSVWESKESFERFFNQKLEKAMRLAGMPRVEPKFIPIHNMMTEQARTMGH